MIAEQFIASTPETIGLDPRALERLYAYIGETVERAEARWGGPAGSQIAIGRRGSLAGVRSFGSVVQAGQRASVADDTLFCLYSATKGVVGAAIWALIEDGQLRIEERVASIIPEFGGLGKDEITVEQVLLHIAGFPDAPMHPRLWESREGRLERMTGWRLNWEPGSRFEYHSTSAHWVLAEVITRKTGLDFRDYVRERITSRMGVPDLFVGLPDAEHRRAADVVYLGVGNTPEGGWSETNYDTNLHFNLPSQRRAGAPGAGGFSGAGELALFYQRLVASEESGAFAPLAPATIEYATKVRTLAHHADAASGLPINRALSVVVAGDHPAERGFGEHASPRAFGHAGAGGQIAWGDPETGLSVGFCTNAFLPAEEMRERTLRIGTLAVECLA